MDLIRRKLLTSVGVACAVGGCLGPSDDGDDGMESESTAPGGVDGEWPGQGYDRANTGRVPDADPLAAHDVEWRTEIDDEIRRQPVVADGAVFVSEPGQYLHAVEAHDGERRWDRRFDAAVTGTVRYHDGRLYVSVGNGRLHAVDPATGDEEWSIEVADSPLSTAPTIGDGTLVVGTYEGSVVGLDPDDGTERWRRSLEDNRIRGFALADGTVYAGASGLHALTLEDGEHGWDQSVAGLIAAPPAVAGGTVFVSQGAGALFAFDATDGEKRWTFETDETGTSPPAVVDGRVAVGGGDSDRLYVVDAASGEEEWHYMSGDGIVAQPVVAGETIYWATRAGTVLSRRVDADYGDGHEEFGVGGRVVAGMAVVDGWLYVAAGDELVAIRG